MPLHAKCIAGRTRDIDRLGRAVGRMPVDDNPLTGFTNALPVQCVGQHLLRPHQAMERAILGERHRVTQGKFLFERAIGRHAVIVPPRQVADFEIQRAAKGHVKFLKTAANRQQGLPRLDQRAHQRQGQLVALAIKGTVRFCRGFTVFLGVDVRPTTGKQKTVASRHEFLNRGHFRVRRHNQRHSVRDVAHSLAIHRARGLRGVLIIDQIAVSDDPDDRSLHVKPLFCPQSSHLLGEGNPARRTAPLTRLHNKGDVFQMAYDIGDPQFLAAPDKMLAQMRAEGALVRIRVPMLGQLWMTTTDAAARQVLKSPESFVRDNSATGGKSIAQQLWWLPPFLKAMTLNLLGTDGAEHARLRGTVDRAFARQSIAGLRPGLTTMADTLLDQIDPRQPVDIMSAYARPLPLRAICALLGIPDADRDRVVKWIGPVSTASSMPSILRAMPGLWRLMRHFRQDFARLRTTPRPGLISELIHDPDGDLTEQELLSMVTVLFIAGHETTVHLITNSLNAILRSPDLRRHMADHPDTLPLTIEEFMRHTSPVLVTKPLFVTHDLAFEGIALKKGEMVMAGLLAANHDPDRHETPTQLIPDRRPNAHLGFGHGPHICLGMQLARAEAEIALTRFFTRFPHAQLADPHAAPKPLGKTGMNALARLDVVLTP